MSKRCELQKEYYQAKGNYKGNGKYSDEYVSWLEVQILALRIHDVSGSLGFDEESQYRIDLINELINIYEHPEDSNKEWKDAIIGVAREKGYGNDR